MTTNLSFQTTNGSEKVFRGLAAEASKRKPRTVLWMGIAFVVALALASAILAINGTNHDSLAAALRLTGRWSFLLFWLAYAGGAMAALFGPTFAPLARRGRDFGLAYASAQLVHVGLVIRLYQITSRLPLTGKPLVLFTVAIVWTYLLAVFSVGGLSNILGSRRWRALRIAGLNYILFAFAIDFVPVAVHWTSHYEIRRLVEYGPFAAMCLAAPVLVLAAAAQKRLALGPKSPVLRRPSINIARL